MWLLYLLIQWIYRTFRRSITTPHNYWLELKHLFHKKPALDWQRRPTETKESMSHKKTKYAKTSIRNKKNLHFSSPIEWILDETMLNESGEYQVIDNYIQGWFSINLFLRTCSTLSCCFFSLNDFFGSLSIASSAWTKTIIKRLIVAPF